MGFRPPGELRTLSQCACVNQTRGRLLDTIGSSLSRSFVSHSQASGTSGMEDHSQNDPARRDQDEVSGMAALNRNALINKLIVTDQ